MGWGWLVGVLLRIPASNRVGLLLCRSVGGKSDDEVAILLLAESARGAVDNLAPSGRTHDDLTPRRSGAGSQFYMVAG